jgi:hypothetical protein
LPLAHVGDKRVKRFHFGGIIGRLPYMRATVTLENFSPIAKVSSWETGSAQCGWEGLELGTNGGAAMTFAQNRLERRGTAQVRKPEIRGEEVDAGRRRRRRAATRRCRASHDPQVRARRIHFGNRC